MLLGGDGERLRLRRQRQRRRPSWAPATTSSSGTRATATTRSRARTAPTRCCSSAPTSPRTSTSPPTAGACGSSATSPTSTMDLDDVENIDFRALGGADNIVVGDLTGTDVTRIDLDLRGPNGGGDGAADTVTVNGTQGADVVRRRGRRRRRQRLRPAHGGQHLLPGAGQRPADAQRPGRRRRDQRHARWRPTASSSPMNGGLGDDLAHRQRGRRPGQRRRRQRHRPAWAPATTPSSGTPATTTTRSRARPASTRCCSTAPTSPRTIDISANGGRVRFFRDIANVMMDLNDVEGIDFNALGGADTIIVNDLTGTDVTEVNIDLAGRRRRRRRRGRHRHRQRHQRRRRGPWSPATRPASRCSAWPRR